MASHPPAACCFQGTQHQGQPLGSLSSLGDFEIYTSFPDDRSTDYGVLILTDIIGHRFNNAQLLADKFAANGYFVMMPDLFYGDPVPLNRPGDFDMQKWRRGEYGGLNKSHTPSTIDPIVHACLVEMRTKYQCKKIAAAGYCFGAKYVVRHLVSGPSKIDVGYAAHPSFIDEDELKSIKGPLAISAAEKDSIFPAEKRHDTEVILKDLGLPYQINLYGGVGHGFAVRGDPDVRHVEYAKENSFLQAALWFKEHLEVSIGVE
ncbi:esterase/lipase [Capronia coronata CBS 617.96]|uniref:Esterase/lipase n=1 Tax=Capronia coronata CBS 617.96 TaxID=1182541 RepID=W9XTY0_9EURO|nr:esterase/lipase [Capronia coronata CBS 617.96]EXJ80436.1 esterase/lipase [Capronia coronata CBS 617.96]